MGIGIIDFIGICVMNISYPLGSMLEYIEADNALSNRSTCRTCQEKIAKGEARLAYTCDGSLNYRYWFHVKCFVLKPKFKDIDPSQDKQICNLSLLEKEDQERIIQNLKEQCQNLKKGIVKIVKCSKNVVAKTKSKPKAKAKGPKKASNDSQQEQSDSDYSEGQKGTKKVKADIEEKKDVVAPVSAFSEKQQLEFKTLVDKYLAMSAIELKNILGLNSQSKSGNKVELAQKCADGELFGKIPTCAQCGGGKLRFSRDTKSYKCPGYMDDDEFKNCNKVFAMQEITRDKWIVR